MTSTFSLRRPRAVLLSAGAAGLAAVGVLSVLSDGDAGATSRSSTSGVAPMTAIQARDIASDAVDDTFGLNTRDVACERTARLVHRCLARAGDADGFEVVVRRQGPAASPVDTYAVTARPLGPGGAVGRGAGRVAVERRIGPLGGALRLADEAGREVTVVVGPGTDPAGEADGLARAVGRPRVLVHPVVLRNPGRAPFETIALHLAELVTDSGETLAPSDLVPCVRDVVVPARGVVRTCLAFELAPGVGPVALVLPVGSETGVWR